MEQFKGYIVTDGKKPLEKFKNRDDFKTYDMVKNLPDFAGVIQEGYLYFDIDDEVVADKYMTMVKELGLKTKVYKTTRGVHSWFKETEGVDGCKTNTSVASGFIGDFKIGSRTAIAIMKLNGEERVCIYDNGIGDLPRFLEPIGRNLNFISKEAGDGRNQSLFNYILTLQSEGFSVEEARETIRIINKYVLVDPLSTDELETIIRDDAFKKETFYVKGKFQFDNFSKYLISQHKVIKINNQLHSYNDGIYTSDNGDLEKKMIGHISNLRASNRSEVLKYIDVYIRDNTEVSPPYIIAFNNGLYDLSTDSFKPWSSDVILTNKIGYDFRPDAYSKIADDTLNKLACNDLEIRSLMEEMIGYTFYRSNDLDKAFILTGDKSNGKSTFLEMLTNLLGGIGGGNVSTIDLGDLGDRFKTVGLLGKLANIGDDIGDDFITDISVFKKLCTGNPLTVERKGEDAFDMKSYAKLIFSANNIPRVRDSTGAVLRRLLIIPFNAKFSPNDPDYDPFIKHKLATKEVMEYLIVLGLKGLKRILTNNSFTESKEVDKALEEYKETINPLISFVKEQGLDEIVDKSSKEVYLMYSTWCDFSNLMPLSRQAFTTQLNQLCDLETKPVRIDGKVTRVFKEL